MSDSERYFPNHKMNAEVGLAEYSLASARLASEEQALNWTSRFSAAITTLVTFVAFRATELDGGLEASGISNGAFKMTLLLAVIMISYMSISHIAELIRSRTFAARKIIVIRRMLGVSYGENTLVLPNWRIEGADNPFAIRLFPGFRSHLSFPVHLILLSGSFSFLFLANDAYAWAYQKITGHAASLPVSGYALAAAWYVFGLFAYRRNLRESSETLTLSVARLVSKVMRIPISRNLEYALYLIKLDIEEARRLKYDSKSLEQFAVLIEDQNYKRHRGISVRGIGRAVLGLAKGKRAGGGSTITQQFVRSNFIYDLKPLIRRKVVEVILAFWIEQIWVKDDIIRGYLCTVRFDNRVYGFHRAARHFFEENTHQIEAWQAFILIERLGNIRNSFLGRRILALLRKCIDGGLLSFADAEKALDFYESSRRFNAPPGDLSPDEVRSALQKQPSAIAYIAS